MPGATFLASDDSNDRRSSAFSAAVSPLGVMSSPSSSLLVVAACSKTAVAVPTGERQRGQRGSGGRAAKKPAADSRASLSAELAAGRRPAVAPRARGGADNGRSARPTPAAVRRRDDGRAGGCSGVNGGGDAEAASAKAARLERSAPRCGDARRGGAKATSADAQHARTPAATSGRRAVARAELKARSADRRAAAIKMRSRAELGSRRRARPARSRSCVNVPNTSEHARVQRSTTATTIASAPADRDAYKKFLDRSEDPERARSTGSAARPGISRAPTAAARRRSAIS